ncbi:phosphatidate cytidylyltransferase [Sporocytophaga myxococcoides]|uniref:phosphatidate cytidylyltransferase n=1 Tax=Sporocytophaga myxococcoides TaxID=153721 RepID=UPI00048ABD7F|nr:phosphatidate cytidylyltransferase [Sporocytophaga myxococcoides]
MKLVTKIRNMGNLTQRIIAGLAGAFIMVSAICFNEWSYFALVFTICLLSLIEFYNLIEVAEIKPNKIFGVVSGMMIFTLFFLIEKQVLTFDCYFLLFPFLFLLFLMELFRKNDKPFFNIAFTFLGNIYIALPFGLLNVCAFYLQEYNFHIILGILLILWANDIGGYVAGMALGKTKLFFRISPKKTWEGSIGGGLFALAIGFTLSLFWKELDTLHWLIMAAIIVVVGSYGDLVESLLKRSLAIKDSAQTIPGHGGFLDRFDGLLLSSPFIAAFLKIFS